MAAVVVYFFRSFIESLSSRQLCSGGMHTIALTKSGEVLSWGCNDEGGLGRDTPEDEDCFLPGKVRSKDHNTSFEDSQFRQCQYTDER